MPRSARIVVPNYPHHLVQRGNRQQPVFFKESDYQYYKELAKEWTEKCGVSIWAYCLMPTHVHFIAVPKEKDALRAAFSQIHKRYTAMINKREGWTGHLWQSRFASYVMDENYTLTAWRYIEMNPVRSGIITKPEEYAWSSAAAHVGLREDDLLKHQPLVKMIGDWSKFLEKDISESLLESMKRHQSSGKPAGSEAFLERIKG